MVLSWFQDRPSSVDDLIARKKYARAIDVIRAAMKKRRNDRRLRRRLADVLILNGQTREAVAVLNALADDTALAGDAAQAIAILKRVDSLDPGRPDVEEKLAYYIRHQQRPSGDPWADRPRPAEVELGMEEIPDQEPAAPTLPPERPEPVRVKLQPLAEPPAAEPDIGEAFRVELQALLDDALSPEEEPPARAGGAASTPLFRDFGQKELVEVIRGLELAHFAPGEIIVTEGEPGNSLFVLAAGRVRAFVRDPTGRNAQVRELGEGEFFGEISLLTGQPRSATVTAGTRCELLVLDRGTLDRIAERHPRVHDVLREFQVERSDSSLEAAIRRIGGD